MAKRDTKHKYRKDGDSDKYYSVIKSKTFNKKVDLTFV